MKLLILDRDGVINEDSDDFIKSADEWIPIPGSLEAIARFNRAGYSVVVVTNQSGIARGLYDLDTLHNMHQKMDLLLDEIGWHVDAVLYCPHLPKDKCSCRKPLPGMLHDVAMRYQISLSKVAMVGDSLRDVQAAMAAGAKPILVRTGKGERTLENASIEELAGVPVYDSLADYADRSEDTRLNSIHRTISYSVFFFKKKKKKIKLQTFKKDNNNKK